MDSSPVQRQHIAAGDLPSLPSPSRQQPHMAAGAITPNPTPSAGTKRPAPTLLPAFEPLSSSPGSYGLPRPTKRPALGSRGASSSNAHLKYPTPVPTSSTGILSSSPPHVLNQSSSCAGAVAPGGHASGVSGVATRPGLQRTLSTTSEKRAPLCDVPSITLDANGDEILMGRSSNSSHYQLSANKLVSRVHVRARYIPPRASSPTPATEHGEDADENENDASPKGLGRSSHGSARGQPGKVEIVCTGWNGLKVHCEGRTWELSKGDSFTSETEGAEIMLDVQDARVRLRWPVLPKMDAGAGARHHESLGNLSDSSWDDSPRHRRETSRAIDVSGGPNRLQSSPLRRNTRIASPESPTPANNSMSGAGAAASLPALLSDDDDVHGGGASLVEIYEDPDANEEDGKGNGGANVQANVSVDTIAAPSNDSFSSDLSEPENDPDEENDPIIMSFGPFGENISRRFASFAASSPKVGVDREAKGSRHNSPYVFKGAVGLKSIKEENHNHHHHNSNNNSHHSHHNHHGRRRATTTPEPEPPLPGEEEVEAITNHAVNQLAFSRLSSTPLSTILNNLPAYLVRAGPKPEQGQEQQQQLTKNQLRRILEACPCIGTIPRQGKDAAGKALENEYYYVPESDPDSQRRAAVEALRKPSLRSCRKQHKVCLARYLRISLCGVIEVC